MKLPEDMLEHLEELSQQTRKDRMALIRQSVSMLVAATLRGWGGSRPPS